MAYCGYRRALFSADEGLGPVKGWLEFSQPGERWPAEEMLFCCKGSVRFGHPFMIGFLTVGPHKEKECLFCVCVKARERGNRLVLQFMAVS